jgi:hypothetical protein
MNIQRTPADFPPIELDSSTQAAFAVFALRKGDKAPIAQWLRVFLTANEPSPLRLVLSQLIMMLEGTDRHFKFELKRCRVGNPNDKSASEWERRFLGDVAMLRYADLLSCGVPEYGLTTLVAAEIAGLAEAVMATLSVPTNLGQKSRRKKNADNKQTEKQKRGELEQRIQEYVRKALQEKKRETATC